MRVARGIGLAGNWFEGEFPPELKPWVRCNERTG